MKTLYLISFAVLMLMACSGNKVNSRNSDAAVDSVAEVENVAQESTGKTFVLTEKGVGSLRMMRPFKDMSKSDEGLYNRVKIHSYVEESSLTKFYEYTLYWDEEKVANFTLPNSKSPIRTLHVYSPRVTLANGTKVGDSLREFVKKKGVKASAENDEIGSSYFGYVPWISLGKICVAGWWSDEDILNEEAKEKARKSEMGTKIILGPEDIKPEMKITDLCVYRKDE